MTIKLFNSIYLNNLRIENDNKKIQLSVEDNDNNFENLVTEYTQLSLEHREPTSLNGKIEYINLEGGFYGIITESNEKYIPINIQDDLKQYVNKSIIITNSYSKRNTVSIFMWGKLIFVNSFDIVVS